MPTPEPPAPAEAETVEAPDERSGKTPSGVRQFLLTAGFLGVAAVFCGAFVFSETRNLDPSTESRKIQTPAAAPIIVATPAATTSGSAIGATSAAPKQDEVKPVSTATEHDKPVAELSRSPVKPAAVPKQPTRPRPASKPSGSLPPSAYEHM